jgi:histidyl-tRNA synthetase
VADAEGGGRRPAIQAPRGTFDVLPEEGERRRRLWRIADALLSRAGYAYADTPVFEDTELFARGVGEATDIVQKEMFTFEDQGGRSISLRPEGTAGFCRAYVEHGMHKLPQPVKLWYLGPFFRYEAPQAGRFRQFTQVGAEAIGSDDPSLDAELILLLAELLREAGAAPFQLKLGSLGTPETRREYADELRAHLRAREDLLSDEVRARLDSNPLRAFDSDHPGTREALRDAPRLLDRVGDDDREHFDKVRGFLDDAGVEYEVDPTLVRGLDYYTRTVFEFESPKLGAQSGLGGGGRYDLLIEDLGGPPTPAVGWAAGIERILLASGGEDVDERRPVGAGESVPAVYVALDRDAEPRAAFRALLDLRANGAQAEMEQAGRSLKGQLKQADRRGADYVVIARDGEWTVRDMKTGDERGADSPDAAVAAVLGRA